MNKTEDKQLTNFTFANYLFISLEGAFFMGGLAFVNANTVMPKIIKNLDGPNWLIAIMPLSIPLGFVLGPIFTAHHVESLTTVKKFMISIGIFMRIPFLITGFLIIYLSAEFKYFIIAVIAFTPVFSGFMCGLTLSAFFELLNKVIPQKKRAHVLALRFLLMSIIGIVASVVIHYVLDQYPGMTGYGILYFITFGFLTLSFFSLVMIKEPPHLHKIKVEKKSFFDNLKKIPKILSSNHSYKMLVGANICQKCIFITVPFLAIYATEQLNVKDSFLGTLTSAIMIGGIIGNSFAIWFAPRLGNKTIIIMGLTALIGCFLLVFAPISKITFLAMFFLLGAGRFLSIVGFDSFLLDVVVEENRPTCTAFYATAIFPFLLFSAGLSAFLMEFDNGIFFASIITLLFLITGITFISRSHKRNSPQ